MRNTLLAFLAFRVFLALPLLAGPADDTRAALHALRPQLIEPRDYTVAPDGTIATWTAPRRFAQPAAPELAEALVVRAAQRAQLATLHDGLLAAYSALAPGEQEFYRAAFTAVRDKLRKGDVPGARALIATSPAPTESLAAARAAMLALFPTP